MPEIDPAPYYVKVLTVEMIKNEIILVVILKYQRFYVLSISRVETEDYLNQLLYLYQSPYQHNMKHDCLSNTINILALLACFDL